MFTNLSVELVIAAWGQSTVTPDTTTEYTQINERPQAAESFRYPQSSILCAQLCHTAVSVFSLSLRLTFVSRLDLWEHFSFTPKRGVLFVKDSSPLNKLS
jgi:hypothetical protein